MRWYFDPENLLHKENDLHQVSIRLFILNSGKWSYHINLAGKAIKKVSDNLQQFTQHSKTLLRLSVPYFISNNNVQFAVTSQGFVSPSSPYYVPSNAPEKTFLLSSHSHHKYTNILQSSSDIEKQWNFKNLGIKTQQQHIIFREIINIFLILLDINKIWKDIVTGD